jgi:pyruvate,water dikinase
MTESPTDAAPDRATWGGKGAALARLRDLGFPVPPLAVVPPDADDVDAAVADALERLAHPPFVAVRSSAADEDGADHAFAGALDSFLFVPPGRVAERVRDVRQSGDGERVRAYRAARGLDGPGRLPAVLVQTVVDADVSGVAFSADPVTGDTDTVVISAAWGLGSAVVDGRAEAETLRLGRDGEILDRTPGAQTVADRFDAEAGEGVAGGPVDDSGPVLSDADARRVADLTRRAASAFGAPQDVEWAIADGELWILQSRPITTFPTPADGRIRLWDNANIVESYAGVTTPLTYSFARRAYAAVYREFCRILKVPEARVEAEAETFEQMIGLVRGRVYYNLGSWYRVLALLPGYRLNAGLMEGMMGVREGIPDALRPEPPSTGRVADALALGRTVIGLVVAHVRLPRMRRAFYRRVDNALREHGAETDGLGLDALAEAYAALDRTLLRKWDAPLVNDFFAMIWFGLTQRAAERWLDAGVLGGLLAGDGDVISAEPARRVEALARASADDLGWVETLLHGDREAVEAGLAERPGLSAAVTDYVTRFGDRCLEELKLESPTLADDPTPLFRSVGARAWRIADGDVREPGADADRLREEAEARAGEALSGHPVRRRVFQVLLRHARARVRDRENLRFERTRVFGRARRLVLAMGERLAEAGRLNDARDVFWLEVEELLGLVRGTATTRDVRGLVAVRRAEFEGFRDGPAPPDRFTTRGPVATAELTADVPAVVEAEGDVRTGLGCCAGVVEGTARVVRDPRGVELAPGTILVAERTDPGWVLLFPACAGFVVERGSLLSHSAIVARELGIPAAVAVPGATGWLRDGDRVRLDGSTGRVERIHE